LKKVDDSKLSFIIDDILDFEKEIFKWSSRDDSMKDIALSKTVQDLNNRISQIDAFIKKIKQIARETTVLQLEETPSLTQIL